MLIAGPNLTIDRTSTIPALRPGDVLRLRDVDVTPGGKGLNVARAALALGGQPMLVAFLPGRTGRAAGELIADEGVPLAGVIANAVFEPLFEPGDAEALASVPAEGDAGAAAAAARTRIARTADEAEQLARVRPCLAELPFLFAPRLDTAAVAGLGERLAGL